MAATLEKRDNTNELQAPTRMACSVFSMLKSGLQGNGPEARGAYYTQALYPGKTLEEKK